MADGSPLHMVTGALGHTGRSITERLLARGVRVRTLTHSPDRPNRSKPAQSPRSRTWSCPERIV
jgi:uncharacterized protein YbjT (DUF2867 family)